MWNEGLRGFRADCGNRRCGNKRRVGIPLRKGYTAAEIKAEIDRGYPHGHVTFFWKVLANHHPERFALEQLDRTQSVNKLLEAEKSSRT